MIEGKKTKDSFYAKASFYLSLGFWIPLFNLAICSVSIALAITSLRMAHKEPNKYGGRRYAIIALVLSVTSILLTVVGFIIYTAQKGICNLP